MIESQFIHKFVKAIAEMLWYVDLYSVVFRIQECPLECADNAHVDLEMPTNIARYGDVSRDMAMVCGFMKRFGRQERGRVIYGLERECQE